MLTSPAGAQPRLLAQAGAPTPAGAVIGACSFGARPGECCPPRRGPNPASSPRPGPQPRRARSSGAATADQRGGFVPCLLERLDQLAAGDHPVGVLLDVGLDQLVDQEVVEP